MVCREQTEKAFGIFAVVSILTAMVGLFLFVVFPENHIFSTAFDRVVSYDWRRYTPLMCTGNDWWFPLTPRLTHATCFLTQTIFFFVVISVKYFFTLTLINQTEFTKRQQNSAKKVGRSNTSRFYVNKTTNASRDRFKFNSFKLCSDLMNWSGYPL